VSEQRSFSFPDDIVIDQRIIESNRKFRAIPPYAVRVMAKLFSMGKSVVKKWTSRKR